MTMARVSTLGLALMTPTDQWPAPFDRRELQVLVYLDGVEVHAGAFWEFWGIYVGGVRPGRFFLSNCECGSPACAHIYWPAVIEHKGGEVHWLIPQQPWAATPRIPRRVRFDRAAYRTECERFAAVLDACCNALSPPGIKTTVTGDPFRAAGIEAIARRFRGATKARLRHEQARFKANAETEPGGYRWRA